MDWQRQKRILTQENFNVYFGISAYIRIFTEIGVYKQCQQQELFYVKNTSWKIT